jgi:hypothetical protein
MPRTIRRLLSAVTLILVLAMPTAAYARFDVEGGSATPAGSVAAATIKSPTRVLVVRQAPQQGFQWGDAALGMAAALCLVAIIGVGIEAQRRHSHHQLAS